MDKDTPKSNSHVNLYHARTSFQKNVMKKIEKDGVCPFCIDFCQNAKPQYHTKPVLKKSNYWAVTENFEPYEGSRIHFVIIYTKNHATDFTEIPLEAILDFFEVLAEVKKNYAIEGGVLLLRFGDTNFTGGSVDHLHFQLIAGGSREKNEEKLWTVIGYKDTPR